MSDNDYVKMAANLAGNAIDLAMIAAKASPVSIAIAGAGMAADAACDGLRAFKPAKNTGNVLDCKEDGTADQKYCPACTASDCLSVAGDVNTGFTVGGIAAGSVTGGAAAPIGMIVGTVGGLAKSYFSGDLMKCAKGVAHNVWRAVKAGAKFMKTAEKFIPKVMSSAKRYVGKVVDGAKKVLDAGMKVVGGVVTVSKAYVNSAVQRTRTVITNAMAPALKIVHSAVKGTWREW